MRSLHFKRFLSGSLATLLSLGGYYTINQKTNTAYQTGQDSYGKTYSNIDEMWQKEFNQNSQDANAVGSKDNWYNKAAQYWENAAANYDGMLGGFARLNDPDVKDSLKFITYFFENNLIKNDRVIDCGAGVGRVSKELLCRIFKEVDLVEQNPHYVEEAKKLLKDYPNMRDFYAEGLQTFQFKKKYDCIWVQWVSSHLTDEDYIAFLKRSADSLTETGIIVVKENLADSDFVVHKDDFSVTRSDKLYKALFEKAGLKVIREELQKDFPHYMFKVNQYALRRATSE